MDVKVKTGYDGIIASLENIERIAGSEKPSSSLSEIFLNDIYSFIHLISKQNGDERYKNFLEVYTNSKYTCSLLLLENRQEFALPIIYSRLQERIINSNNNNNNSLCSLGELLIAFFFDLGRCYIFNSSEKKDIDKNNYINYIRFLQNSMPKQPEKVKQVWDSEIVKEDTSFVNIKNVKVNETLNNRNEKNTKEALVEGEESVDDLLNNLDSLVGLAGVKREVNSLVNLLKINSLREERGLKVPNVSKHLVFLGNPGTGKTTVARLLAKIYQKLGLLEKGQLVEVDRANLVAGHVGQTALKTKEKIDEAMGGILFIDEAYTLVKEGADFGQEAIDTLLKAMEDSRDKIVVIVAGYPEPMNKFLESNPGLRSRFYKNIFFEDYNAEELFTIFNGFCEKQDLKLNEDARTHLKTYLEKLSTNKKEDFANGREMRNLFELSLMNQVNRLVDNIKISDEDLMELRSEDLNIKTDEVKKH